MGVGIRALLLAFMLFWTNITTAALVIDHVEHKAVSGGQGAALMLIVIASSMVTTNVASSRNGCMANVVC